MVEVTFTEKELGFINECAIDKKGVLVEMPANPFPSLYRKGVITKKGDDLTVTKDFRDMFCLADQVVHIDLTKADGGPEDGTKKFKYGETGDVIIEDAPADYAGFRQAIAANLRDRRTKGIDEFQLIDKAVQVYDAAREARAANGDEGTRSEHTTIGSRWHWRYALADAVAAFFGVAMDVDKREIVFTGDLYMAGAAELAFEYLFKIGNRRAQRIATSSCSLASRLSACMPRRPRSSWLKSISACSTRAQMSRSTVKSSARWSSTSTTSMISSVGRLQMITDTKEIAERLRTEANYWHDYNEEDTIFNMSNYHFTESVLTAFGMDDMDIYADMPVYELFGKLADIIDSQKR